MDPTVGSSQASASYNSSAASTSSPKKAAFGLPKTAKAQQNSASSQKLQLLAAVRSRLKIVGDALRPVGKGAAAVFGSACAIIGGSANALMVGITYLGVAPGAALGGLLGGIVGLGVGVVKGNFKQNILDNAKAGAKAGIVVAAIPVAVMVIIPICFASGIARAGKGLLKIASGKSSKAPDAWLLQKFVAKFDQEAVLKLLKLRAEDKKKP